MISYKETICYIASNLVQTYKVGGSFSFDKKTALELLMYIYDKPGGVIRRDLNSAIKVLLKHNENITSQTRGLVQKTRNN